MDRGQRRRTRMASLLARNVIWNGENDSRTKLLNESGSDGVLSIGLPFVDYGRPGVARGAEALKTPHTTALPNIRGTMISSRGLRDRPLRPSAGCSNRGVQSGRWSNSTGCSPAGRSCSTSPLKPYSIRMFEFCSMRRHTQISSGQDPRSLRRRLSHQLCLWRARGI